MEKDTSKDLADAMRANNLLDATKKVDKKEDSHVGYDEFKAMKKHNYQKKKDSTSTSYVIQNKKTGKIVEVKASSPVMAARTVGWRPRHIKVLEINDSKENGKE